MILRGKSWILMTSLAMVVGAGCTDDSESEEGGTEGATGTEGTGGTDSATASATTTATATATQGTDSASGTDTTDTMADADASATSSVDTGTDTSPTTGPTTGPTSGETTSDGTDSETGSTTGSAGACDPEKNDTACDTCVKENCCEQATACLEDADCVCFQECAAENPNPFGCYQQCGISPQDPGPTADVVQCTLGSCAGECA